MAKIKEEKKQASPIEADDEVEEKPEEDFSNEGEEEFSGVDDDDELEITEDSP